MIHLTKREAAAAIRLLGELQNLLEEAIDSALVPGTNGPMPEDARAVARDRRLWKQAEQLVKRLEQLKPQTQKELSLWNGKS